MALGAKLIKVMEACRYMEQDGRNDFQKYDYTKAAPMFGKINVAFVANGLFTKSSFELVESRDVTTSSNKVEKFVIMKATITVHDADDPKEFVTYEGYGSGQDSGDKAIMKSETAALKYAYVSGLCIAMADDPEDNQGTDAYQPATRQRQNTPPPRQSNPAQANELKCAQCGKAIASNVASYSKQKFGRPLCFDCQKKAGAKS